MIDFNDPKLIKKFGSWMQVQVAFYDFLFMTANKICGQHFNEKLGFGSFSDGNDFYEACIQAILEHFESANNAWNQFIEEALNE